MASLSKINSLKKGTKTAARSSSYEELTRFFVGMDRRIDRRSIPTKQLWIDAKCMKKPKRFFFLVLLVVPLVLFTGGFFWVTAGLPDAEIDTNRLHQPSIRITDRSGKLLYDSLSPDSGRHVSIPLDQTPLWLQQATLATEDASFYQNPGIDPAGIIRAIFINLSGGETLSGGSTITQQLARTLLLDESERYERSLRRKLREGLLAWELTQKYPKNKILELYLNQTYYGGWSYGVEAAAQTYFGKPAAQLDLAESALLAGLPQAPSAYDPFADPQAALARRSIVLGLMEKAGYISSQVRTFADREPLNLASTPYPMNAPHFSLMVRSQVEALITSAQIRASGGLVVRTTLDLNDQRVSEQAVQQQLERLKEKGQSSTGFNVNNAALVALDPRTGEILAMVGSPDFNDQAHSGAMNMALFPRQPGSALKPFIYAAAFDPSRLRPWTAATMLLDVSTHFVTHDGEPYTPKNYDGQEHGPVLARQALASSLNIPAVLTLQEIGLPKLFQFGAQVGITPFGNPDQYDLSLALGGGEVRLIDLTAGYAAFAAGGYRVDPFAILEIQDAQGSVLYQHSSSSPRRVIDERVAWLITDILSDDSARLLGFQPHSTLNLDRPAAVKTGTTTNFHDNWTVGFTPNLVVGVWVGNASHEAMRDVNGLTGAAPIWHQVMRDILANQPAKDFQQPPGLKQVEICAYSGLLPTPDCPYRRVEWFIAGTEPVKTDNICHSITLDRTTGQPAAPSTPPDQRKTVVVLELPPAAQNWARSHGLLLMSDLTLPASTQISSSQDRNDLPVTLAILSPAPMTSFLISGATPLDTQSIPIEADGPPGLAQVTIYLDGKALLTSSQSPYRVFWQLVPGDHTVWAEGKTDQGTVVLSQKVTFKVKSAGKE